MELHRGKNYAIVPMIVYDLVLPAVVNGHACTRTKRKKGGRSDGKN